MGNWVREGSPEVGDPGRWADKVWHVPGKGEERGLRPHFLNPFLMCEHLLVLATEMLCRLLHLTCALHHSCPL